MRKASKPDATPIKPAAWWREFKDAFAEAPNDDERRTTWASRDGRTFFWWDSLGFVR